MRHTDKSDTCSTRPPKTTGWARTASCRGEAAGAISRNGRGHDIKDFVSFARRFSLNLRIVTVNAFYCLSNEWLIEQMYT